MRRRRLREWKGVCIYRPSTERAGAGVASGLGAIRYRDGCAETTDSPAGPDPLDLLPSGPLRRLWMEPSLERSSPKAGPMFPASGAERGAADPPPVAICAPAYVAEVVRSAARGRPGVWLLLLDPLTRPVGIVPVDTEDAESMARSIVASSLLSGADSSILVMHDPSSRAPSEERADHLEMLDALSVGAHVFDVPIRDLVVSGSDRAMSYAERMMELARENEWRTGRQGPSWLKEELDAER